ncbi:hypothetical protein RD792_014582 [Penstemon davidsonii]|uniref:CRM domain-containing protein n=1 Tax=Penstemon davidsonii TaxID=160366 RepID=A0ABR0CPP3_9LAMI|nr:hypothetical protein RD792_014582 [Penstemon davidsonii]
MASSPFTIAYSPMSLSFTPRNSSSKSLYLLAIQPQTHFLNNFRPKKLRISCCQQTVQFENETPQQNAILVKKKRKPRPSFLEQIQDKWSLKNPSLRQNFPWEEEEVASVDTNQEFQPQNSRSETVSEKNTSVCDSVSSSDVKINSSLAPWAHGKESRKEHFVNSEKNQDNVHVNDKYSRESVAKKLIPDVKIEGKCVEFDAVPIVSSDKEEVLDDEESENSPTIYRDISSVERSSDTSASSRLPWERKVDEEFRKEEKLRKSNTELAERSMPESELKRLRNVSLRMFERIKVGAAGVTQALVDDIHEKWKDDEVVKIKFEGPPTRNMKRIHDILERRTGGLIIYRSGSLVVLYRGLTYKLDCVKSYSKTIQASKQSSEVKDFPQRMRVENLSEATDSSRTSSYSNNLSEEEEMDLSELNLLLDELGPRFVDWSGREPLPVDADLLPNVVPGYKPPFRLLPYGYRQTLRDKETTFLRRTVRTMPPHFALGRNRELQGLASAMVKLWEKSAVAKIAIKRGVYNTSNERMAEELKMLTGGTLLSRNKEYIVFYRGNDFLPPSLKTELTKAEEFTVQQQDEEEQARNRAATLLDLNPKSYKQPLVAGTLAETLAAKSRWGNQPDSAQIEKMMRDAALAKHASLINSLHNRLALAKGKMGQAEKALQKVLENREPSDLPVDLETLTDEERFLFRKIGWSMKPYLVLGRREIFDGTIENMHLHWKYRELVKIIVERKTFAQVRHIAVSLEAESGGVLVSVEKTPKGYAIIVYRGKNYQRPDTFRPKNLLTKRQALARSIELQRREEDMKAENEEDERPQSQE